MLTGAIPRSAVVVVDFVIAIMSDADAVVLVVIMRVLLPSCTLVIFWVLVFRIGMALIVS